jgi:hypothetical protein
MHFKSCKPRTHRPDAAKHVLKCPSHQLSDVMDKADGPMDMSFALPSFLSVSDSCPGTVTLTRGEPGKKVGNAWSDNGSDGGRNVAARGLLFRSPTFPPASQCHLLPATSRRSPVHSLPPVIRRQHNTRDQDYDVCLSLSTTTSTSRQHLLVC